MTTLISLVGRPGRIPLRRRLALGVAALVATSGMVLAGSPAAQAAVQRVQFAAGGNYLVVEFLDNDLVHFELGAGTSPGTGSDLFATEQVSKRNYPGPTSLTQNGGTLVIDDFG